MIRKPKILIWMSEFLMIFFQMWDVTKKLVFTYSTSNIQDIDIMKTWEKEVKTKPDIINGILK